MMRPLDDCRLYGIIDLGYVERGDAARIVEQMIEGGVDLIQLRGKNKSIGELMDLAAELHDFITKSSHAVDRERLRRNCPRVPRLKACTSARMMIPSKSRGRK